VVGTFSNARYFETQLHEGSVPDLLIGNISVKELTESDRLIRNYRGKLPDVEVAYIDEVFNANSVTLHSLHSIMNERIFDSGDGIVKVPLISLFGAANIAPKDNNLQAFADRFLYKPWLQDLQKESNTLKQIHREINGNDPKITTTFTLAELEEAQREVQAIAFPQPTAEALAKIVGLLKAQKGIVISTRKVRWLVGFLKAIAWIRGEHSVSRHLLPEFLPDCCWLKNYDSETHDIEEVAHLVCPEPASIAKEMTSKLEGELSKFTALIEEWKRCQKSGNSAMARQKSSQIDNQSRVLSGQFANVIQAIEDLRSTASKGSVLSLNAQLKKLQGMRDEFDLLFEQACR
jgi:MoxR-like ATPase